MKISRSKIVMNTALALALSVGVLLPAAHPAPSDTKFLQSAYLWTQATDTDLNGNGDWGMYKAWLGVSRLGAESDPGGWGKWEDTAEGWNNNKWGEQQTRYGTRVLPDILLGIGTMPYDSTPGATWEQKLAWEDKQWQLEANNDTAVMQHFVNLGNHLVDWHYKSVIIRMDYEFDGGWDPYGNLNVMSGMPNNFIKAWQNIVTTVRNTVKARDPKIKVKFLWNPTDSNVQVQAAKFYPGDAYVDYIGFDNYDSDYTGIYKPGVQPDEAVQQKAWTNSIRPRIQWFADFASAANPGKRNGYLPGRSVPLIVGEWGLWQVAKEGRGAGGDDPAYIQNMYDWMTTHNVYMECYFETPADGVSTLWPGGYPKPGSGNHSWGIAGSPYPKAAAKYRQLFGGTQPVRNPVGTAPVSPSTIILDNRATTSGLYGRRRTGTTTRPLEKQQNTPCLSASRKSLSFQKGRVNSLVMERKTYATKKAMSESFTPEELKRMQGISNGGYHYLGAAKILAPIGKAFAEAMAHLQRPQ